MPPAYLHTYLPLRIKKLLQHIFKQILIGIGMQASFWLVFAKSPGIPPPPDLLPRTLQKVRAGPL